MSYQPRYWVQYTQTIQEAGKPVRKEDCVAGFTRDRPISDFSDLERVIHELKAATLQVNPSMNSSDLTITIRSWQRFEDPSQIIVPQLVQTNIKP